MTSDSSFVQGITSILQGYLTSNTFPFHVIKNTIFIFPFEDHVNIWTLSEGSDPVHPGTFICKRLNQLITIMTYTMYNCISITGSYDNQ